MDLPIKEIASVAVSILVVIGKAVWDSVKKRLTEKMRTRVEEIAVVVEALYDGVTSADKLAAFKELCKNKGLNVSKAVKYLETNIIPISKSINSYIITENKENKEEATN